MAKLPTKSPKVGHPKSSKRTPFGKEIAKLRIDHDLTQHQLADKIEYSASHIASLETGRGVITDDFIKSVINAFDCDDAMEALLGETAELSTTSVNIYTDNLLLRKLLLDINSKRMEITDEQIATMQQVLSNEDINDEPEAEENVSIN